MKAHAMAAERPDSTSKASTGIGRLIDRTMRARHDLPCSRVRTTHPDHVPERYVIYSAGTVCRVGTLAAYEAVQAEDPVQGSTLFVFDPKLAAGHLVDAIRRSPCQVNTE